MKPCYTVKILLFYVSASQYCYKFTLLHSKNFFPNSMNVVMMLSVHAALHYLLYLSIFMFIKLIIYPLSLPLSLFLSLSVSPSLSLFLSLSLSLPLPPSLSFFLSLSLSLSLFLYLSPSLSLSLYIPVSLFHSISIFGFTALSLHLLLPFPLPPAHLSFYICLSVGLSIFTFIRFFSLCFSFILLFSCLLNLSFFPNDQV